MQDTVYCGCQSLELCYAREESQPSFITDFIYSLIQELKLRPCPVVLASFSGGPKACMYKVLQVNSIHCLSK